YWQRGNINRLADRDDVQGVTKAVNGSLLGLRCSPRSTAAMKRQVYDDLEHTFDEAIEDTLARMRDSFTWGDLPEALRARSEARPPNFPGLH
ncbi:MAG TPA: hypothetical protein VKJ07_23350, partial [Mycobacteriales bacterium]|nr:hypothetical protein [Mycobacteriales bacterium]